MTPDSSAKGQHLCSGFGSEEPVWEAQPPPGAVPAAAHEWLCHGLARHLRARGVRPSQLMQEVGNTQASWRSKLNGNRPFQLEDIVRIALAVDIEILDVVPSAIADLRDLMPPPYRPLLSHHRPGCGMPTFRRREPDWDALIAGVAEWWTAEAQAGRAWTLSRDVIAQRIVAMGDKRGLPSRLSAAGAVHDDYCDVEWVTSSVHLRLLWMLPGETQTATEVRSDLRKVGHHIWEIAEASLAEQTILVIAASAQVLAGVEQILELGGDSTDAWTAATLTHAQRFGLAGIDAATPDVRIAAMHDARDEPMRWFRLKT